MTLGLPVSYRVLNITYTNFNNGESAIENAPRLTLRNGQSCIPQHYLQYDHNRETVEALIADVEFCDRYPIFVSEDAGGIFLQIGVIGYDNYKSVSKQMAPKIVFGRKWRVEPNLPTSEIIQTVFLALKKAGEHEIRELFTLSVNGKTTTPFNNHHDLPLMARNRDILENTIQEASTIQNVLKAIKFDGGQFNLEDMEVLRNGLNVITLSYAAKHPKAHEALKQNIIVLLLQDLTKNTLYHALIAEIIAISDRHVDETFKYKGFARFSRDVSAISISELSADLRQDPETLLSDDGERCSFAMNFETERYDTDVTRVPQLTNSPYSKKLHDRLSAMKLSNFDMIVKAQSPA